MILKMATNKYTQLECPRSKLGQPNYDKVKSEKFARPE